MSKPNPAAGLPAIFLWDGGGLSVAIPKRRGSGYLRCPLGHHCVQALSAIESDERVDLCGLDGYLAFDYGHTADARREEIVKRVMPRLAKHFGFTAWREDAREFWRIVQRDPLPSPTASVPKLKCLRSRRKEARRPSRNNPSGWTYQKCGRVAITTTAYGTPTCAQCAKEHKA